VGTGKNINHYYDRAGGTAVTQVSLLGGRMECPSGDKDKNKNNNSATGRKIKRKSTGARASIRLESKIHHQVILMMKEEDNKIWDQW
jgi:hypothetical protein